MTTELEEALQRAEDAETQCSSMVSERDLRIQFLTGRVAALEAALAHAEEQGRRKGLIEAQNAVAPDLRRGIDCINGCGARIKAIPDRESPPRADG